MRIFTNIRVRCAAGAEAVKRLIRGLAAALILAIVVVGCDSLQSPGTPADTILYNGNIIAVDSEFSYAQAIAVTGDRFTAVGPDESIRDLAGPQTRLIDLRGRTVVPGLIDNHFHLAGGGPGVDLSHSRTLAEVLTAIGARVQQSPPGALVMTNGDWHEAQLIERRLPLRNDLDTVAPDNPVVVMRGGHHLILNSAALKRAGIDESVETPAGGKIGRYSDGSLNGELVNSAKALAKLPPRPTRDLDQSIVAQTAEYQKLNAAGITSVRHASAPVDQYRVVQEMQRRGDLTMRVTFLLRFKGAKDIAAAIAAAGVTPQEGDEWVKLGGIKLSVDGGFEGGLMREPYAEPWGRNGTYYGINTMPVEVFTEKVLELNELGWRVATHVLGDAGIDLVLEGYGAAHAQTPISDKRWAIEHGFLPRADQFPRMRELGLVVAAQHHLYLVAPIIEKYWGRERAEGVTPVRTYLDESIPVSGGSDAPVVPYPPLAVIYHFVTRDTVNAGVYGADQRVSREEALRLVTINGAYLTFEEDLKGSIEPGKLADLVVLSGDIMTVPEEQIVDLSVLMTMVGGAIVHEHPEF